MYNENIVALMVDKTEYMIISMIEVMKAGLAYVPLDPKYPNERVRFIFKDTSAKLVLGDDKYMSKISECNSSIPFVSVDKYPKSSEKIPEGLFPVKVAGNHLIYIIFTSGSTGRPKLNSSEFVTILLPHGIEFISTVIKTFLSGKIPLPLSIEYTISKLNIMLQETESPILITNKAVLDAVGLQYENKVYIEDNH